MNTPTTKVKEAKIRGPLPDNDGKSVTSPERDPSFSDDDSLSIRSIDSSRDEMIDSRPIRRPKINYNYPLRLVRF